LTQQLQQALPGSPICPFSAIKGLELLIARIQRPEKLLLLRLAAAGAWLVNDLKPDGGKCILIKKFAFYGALELAVPGMQTYISLPTLRYLLGGRSAEVV
jgi:hypothetical protein